MRKASLPLCRLTLVLALLAFLPARAEESAADIARKSRERGALNLLGLSAQLKLTTASKGGKSKEQVLTTTARKIGERTHSLVRFQQPAGVAGVAVLTVEGAKGEASEISLYLPKLKRVRKVARTQRGQSFMDTDFSYADLGGTGGETDDAMKKVGESKVLDRLAWVLVGKAGPDSPYGEVKVYVDQETYVPTQVEYTDKEGKPFKVYRAAQLKKFKDRVIASRSSMENLQTGSVTTLEVLQLEEAQLGEEAFTERALERG
ncbi:outer membrane lipoprotein-sorting protein [Hyalangium rubrum]|uniref:Outer membrane lipoprotein-sorting protein n=1 Tax=Hyalangium rubrum TaxID=3103134 RepID=A0ABU5H5V3_9BACT|nr:outer membrane lipoprotein-sorting protein [Hyalangium sp. s54d21]MDY7228686.1 outer membrane lipoprotein-sorting protein [Hyalangium sp. s54d21]